VALIQMKKEEHIARLDKLDPRDKFETFVAKWKKIFEVVMSASFSQYLRNGLAYKNKWGSILGDFKKLFNYMLGIGHNEDYWALSSQEKALHHLPHHFGCDMYEMIHDFMGNRPIFNPPHVRDMMDDGDENYKSIGG